MEFLVNTSDAASSSSAKSSAVEPLMVHPRWALPYLAFITLLAAILRFHNLAARTFWFDEGVSVGIARLDWYNFGRILWRREANMSLYYLLLRGWLHFGQSEFFVRTLSVLFALATIPALFILGRRLFGAGTGVITTLLLAVNAYHIRYSQEARSYSLTVLLCVLSGLYFLKCLDRTSHRNRVAYILFSAAAVYAHFYAGLLLLAQWLSLLFLEQEQIPKELRKDWRWIALLVSPIAIFVATTGAGPLRWIQRPGFKDLWELGLRLTGNYGVALLMAYVIAGSAAIVPVILDEVHSGGIKKRVPWKSWRYRFLSLWLFFPILFVLTVSMARPLFLPRYFILCLPPLLLLAANGVSRIRPSWLMTLAILLFVVLSDQGTASYYQHDFEDVQRENWRAASQYVLANYQPGDTIMFHIPMGRMSYEYYRSLQGASVAGPAVLYPTHGDHVVFLDFVEKPSYDQLTHAIPEYRRVWLVLSHAQGPSGPDETSTALETLILASHPHLEPHDFTGLEVSLYSGDRTIP
jgi:mannosyltransferase